MQQQTVKEDVEITFDTRLDNSRVETGQLAESEAGNMLVVTNHEARPNFEATAEGAVHLHSAKTDTVIKNFGENAGVAGENA